MSKPIDVLAVMQRASLRIAELSDGCKTATEAELQEARAAVAELVEAAKEIERMVEVRAPHRIDRGRLIAAIAKATGAAISEEGE